MTHRCRIRRVFVLAAVWAAGSLACARSAPSPAPGPRVMEAVKAAHPGAPILIAVIGDQNGYVAALALPRGERMQHVYLRREGNAWHIVASTAVPAAEVLRRRGVPEPLLRWSDSRAVVDAWMTQLQDPRGEGAEGEVRVERITATHARLRFQPTDAAQGEPVTAFFRWEGEGWRQLTAGTAFDPETLRGLGVPEMLWAGNDAENDLSRKSKR